MYCTRIFTIASGLFLYAGLFAQTQTMQVAGVTRNYIAYAPTGLTGHPPLVYVIHGFNMTGQQEVSLTRMNAVADKEKFVVVYPNALTDASNQPSWDMSGPNDYTFLLAIIDSMAAKYQIDRNKVYASGFSQGGFMSFQLGCRYADKFAAIAPVSGLLTGSCNASRPVPMFLTFGTADVATPASFMQSVDAWVKLIKCPTTPVITQPYPATNPNSVVTRLDYSPCQNGTEVIADSVKGGPHEWPMNTQTKVNNSEEVWAFFKKFSLNTSPVLPGHLRSTARDGIIARYISGLIQVEGGTQDFVLDVMDNQGRRADIKPMGQGRFALRHSAHGIYQLRIREHGKSTLLRLVIP